MCTPKVIKLNAKNNLDQNASASSDQIILEENSNYLNLTDQEKKELIDQIKKELVERLS